MQPWPVGHGELIVICLSGGCKVRIDQAAHVLREGDQIMIEEGERCSLAGLDAKRTILQLVWLPGISGACKHCWEWLRKIYGTGLVEDPTSPH